ncbi:MAG TPA: hypothetical protein VGJ86_02385 [Acidimicrobiales bacterium]
MIAMFEVYCPSHEAVVLLTARQMEAVRSTRDGLLVTWRCWCGQRGQSLDGRPVNDDCTEWSEAS